VIIAAPPSRRVHFPNLDAIRTLAWLAVFVQHAYHFERISPYEPLNALVLEAGGLGVSCFFVLSGFLISYLLLDEATREARSTSPRST
jgi:peptidoglycan/LPS O-acetylase OafA/YrhL